MEAQPAALPSADAAPLKQAQVIVPAGASESDPAKPPVPYAVGHDLDLRARWQNGLLLESSHGDFQAHFGAQINQDWVFFHEDPALRADPSIGTLSDGIFFRRARVILDGRMYETVEWYLEAEFGQSSDVTFGGTWIGLRELPWIGNARFGNVKQAMGLESNSGSRYLTFLEPGLTYDVFHQEYDPGAWFQNVVLDDRATWAVGFYRIDPEDDGADFGDGQYALATRGTWLAWYDDSSQGAYLLHLGASYGHRNAEFNPATGDDVIRLRGRPEVRAAGLLPRFVDTGPIAAACENLVGIEAAWVLGPLSLQSEAVAASVSDAVFPAGGGGTPRGDAMFHGGYAFISWFLSGEHRGYNRKLGTFSRLIPLENFWAVSTPNGTTAGIGAWELAARYSWVDLNDSGIAGGRLHDLTLGVNWYWNPNVKMQLNYLWADRDVDPSRASGDVESVALRFAVDF